MKLNTANITAAAAVIALLLTLFGAIYQQGRLSNQLENLSAQITLVREGNRLDYADLSRDNAALREEMQRGDAALLEELSRDNAALREEMQRGDVALVEELRRDNAALREEMQRGDAALLEELRRSIRQLLDALGSHTHDASGNPVFTVPPGYESDIESRPQ